MQQKEISLPELALVAGTRFLLGSGAGLLIASRMQPTSRRLLGWTLFTIGALTTIPLAMEVLGGRRVLARSFGRREEIEPEVRVH